MARVLLVGGFGDLVVKLRGSFLRAVRDAGHEVLVCVPKPSSAAVAGVILGLREIGARLIEAPLDRTGTNPLSEMAARAFYDRLMRDERPDAVLAYNPKPVMYAVPAARRAGVGRVVAMITGLGYAFTNRSLKARALALAAMHLYRRALPLADAVVFQNHDDSEYFERAGLLAGVRSVVHTPGSGVDLASFPHASIAAPPTCVTFLFLGRLLREKGVMEYVDAARALRELRVDQERMSFRLAGFADTNPGSVTAHEVRQWQTDGVVHYVGRLEDVRPMLRESSVLVLPSHGEGMPMSVLEAMSTGRAVIAGDASGCREAVEDQVTGYLVPPGSAPALAVAMELFLEDPTLVVSMGAAARQRAERLFDARRVNAQLLESLGLTPGSARGGAPAGS